MGGWVVVWWCGDHIGEDLDTPVTWNPHLQMALLPRPSTAPHALLPPTINEGGTTTWVAIQRGRYGVLLGCLSMPPPTTMPPPTANAAPHPPPPPTHRQCQRIGWLTRPRFLPVALAPSQRRPLRRFQPRHGSTGGARLAVAPRCRHAQHHRQRTAHVCRNCRF